MFDYQRQAETEAGALRNLRLEGRPGKGDVTRTPGGFEAQSWMWDILGKERSDPSDQAQERVPV